MDTQQARDAIQERITNFLIDLATSDDLSEIERVDTTEMMAGLGEMLLDFLRFTVLSVEGNLVHVTVALQDDTKP